MGSTNMPITESYSLINLLESILTSLGNVQLSCIENLLLEEVETGGEQLDLLTKGREEFVLEMKDSLF